MAMVLCLHWIAGWLKVMTLQIKVFGVEIKKKDLSLHCVPNLEEAKESHCGEAPQASREL